MKILKSISISMICVVIALYSALILAPKASDPQTHTATIAAVDKSIDTALMLTGSAAVASTAITLIPGDTGTPIAENLADFSSYFMIVLCILYMEKYMLVLFGNLAFLICVPLACILMAADQFTARKLHAWAVKIALTGILFYLMVPASVGVSNMVYNTYQSTIDTTIEAANDISSDIQTTVEGDDTEKHKGISLPTLDDVTEKFTLATEAAERLLHRFSEAFVVLITTTCLIPILVMLLFLWGIRILLGINVTLPDWHLPRRHGRL